MNEKILCENCKKELAVWEFMPTSEHMNNFYCKKCVPRGCDHCNIDEIEYLSEYSDILEQFFIYYKFINKKFVKCPKNEATHYEILDDNMKSYPCIEFDYEEHGYLKKEYDY